MDEQELSQLIAEAKTQLGGKPAKYQQIDRHGNDIMLMLKNDIQLPFICRWLGEKKGEELALNTLRKYVIRKIGRAEYDKYLTRNGWLKQRRHGLTPTPSAKPAEVQKPGGLGFSMDITKPRTLTRTNR